MKKGTKKAKTKKTKEVAVIEKPVVQTVPAIPRMETTLDLMAFAVQSKSGVDQLERLMAMKYRDEDRKAEREYFSALAKFQEAVGPITKDHTVDFTNKEGRRTKYNHATLPQIENHIKGALRASGLTKRFEIQNKDGAQTVTCIITHEGGHSERTSMMAPADTSGSKNAIQALGSAVTYLQRYTLIGALGLVTADEDNDGMTSTAPPARRPVVKKAEDVVIEQAVPVEKPSTPESLELKNLKGIMDSLKAKAPKLHANVRERFTREMGDEGCTMFSEVKLETIRRWTSEAASALKGGAK